MRLITTHYAAPGRPDLLLRNLKMQDGLKGIVVGMLLFVAVFFLVSMT
jgi:hypothetical protein